jgi:aspartyl-tRNA(Asn)/glutamyl-tRNA(Gln) amidotransferase subunit C
MAISEKDVLHVAKLARLELTAEELPQLVHDLRAILDYFAELSTVDTADVEPTTWVAVDRAPFRTDEVRPGVPTAEALAEAPRSASDGFAVPAFVDEP